jgi:hypothetical protein
MDSPSIEQLRHLLAAAQAENRPEEEARLMRMIEARHGGDEARRAGDVGISAANAPARSPAKAKS